MSAELVRRKLLGCQTAAEPDLYFLATYYWGNIFINPRSLEVVLHTANGDRFLYPSPTAVFKIAEEHVNSLGWPEVVVALKGYLTCHTKQN